MTVIIVVLILLFLFSSISQDNWENLSGCFGMFVGLLFALVIAILGVVFVLSHVVVFSVI